MIVVNEANQGFAWRHLETLVIVNTWGAGAWGYQNIMDPRMIPLMHASIQHFELGPYFSENRIIRFGVRTYDFERTIGCEVHDHLFREDSKNPWMTQLTFIRRLFLKQGCLRFLDHTVLSRSFLAKMEWSSPCPWFGGIIVLYFISLFWTWKPPTFPECIHLKSTYLWSKCMAQSPKYMAYI